MTKRTVLVTWVSFNHDPYERDRTGAYVEREGGPLPGATLELLFNQHSPLRGKVERVHVLVRRPKDPEPAGRRVLHAREEEVFEELRRTIHERERGIEVCAEIWETRAAPTDHREIFQFTAETLPRIREANPRATLAFNLSPGTPQMQMVLLLALQARLAGDDVVAFQGTPRDKRRRPEDVVQRVPWNLLRELETMEPATLDGGAPGQRWTHARAQSRRLKEVAKLIERFGRVPFPVLIRGSRGTGKTVVARQLRDLYRERLVRRAGDWTFHLNCAELEGDLLRSELFGHERGAFTGAGERKLGLLERAEHDCAFLDEIHRLDPQAQGMLLLALQRGGHFRRVGGTETVKANFRLIAATNQDRRRLRELLAPDFLDRISDLVIELPDLRECQEDLDDLWCSVVAHACDELVERDPDAPGSQVRRYIAEFVPHRERIVGALRALRLPGNFRDLERLARRLLVAGLARTRALVIREENVREELRRLQEEEQVERAPSGATSAGILDELPTMARCEDFLREQQGAGRTVDARDLVDQWEKRLLLAARTVGGSGRKGAGLLGMPDRTFNARLKQLGVPEEQASTKSPTR